MTDTGSGGAITPTGTVTFTDTTTNTVLATVDLASSRRAWPRRHCHDRL